MMRKVVIEAKNIVKSFGGNRVLDGVSFKLHEGEIVLLQGTNGSGKTTLINILTGNLEPDSGEIRICGETNRNLKFPRPWYRGLIPFSRFSPEYIAETGIGRVWQDVRVFASQSSLDNVAAAAQGQLGESVIPAITTPFLTGRQERKNREQSLNLLDALDVAGLADLPAGEISFGQTKKVAIARALHGNAKILFMDEPLAGLDKAESENAVAILQKLSSEFGITMVVVEHDVNIPRIKEIATEFWHLQNGRISIEKADENQTAPDTELIGWLKNLGDCVETVIPKGTLRIVHRMPNGEKMLSADAVTIKRNGRTVIEEPLNFTLCEGDVAVLQAPNGWGKSSLLEALSGLLPVGSGNIFIKGQAVTDAPVWDRIRQGLHLARTRDALFSHLTVEENLRLNKIFDPVMADKSKRKAGSLSGGETRRLMLECALRSPQGEILLLDEPFQALDTATAHWLRENIENSKKTFLITMPGSAN